MEAAQNRYSGVVALDQWGNAIFETEAAGRAAKAQLLRNTHGEKTIPEMLKKYAVDDYTGKADTDAYARSVYAIGDSQGVDLRGKKIKDLTDQEFSALLDGMKKVEGFKEGTITRTQPRVDAGAPALSPEQQTIHRMAADALARPLGASHSPEQIDALARSAVAVATENGRLGDVQAVFLSKDQQTIAVKHAFGISEIGLQEALNRASAGVAPPVTAPDGPAPVPPREAPQTAALAR